MNGVDRVVKMSDQMRSTKSRPYRMQRRAEHVDQTRQRITDAAIRLHTTVGPASTSIASVAAAAGVTRLTVYRHFADLDALFQACRGDWRSRNPPPDMEASTAIPDLEPRARSAFQALYGWYRQHADELYPIYRDAATMPLATQRALEADDQRTGDALIEGYAAPGAEGRTLRAVGRHLVGFWTWRSLAVQQGLDDADVVDVAVRILLAISAKDATGDRRDAS
jgi:AcrR family transcriptional regulator